VIGCGLGDVPERGLMVVVTVDHETTALACSAPVTALDDPEEQAGDLHRSRP
jgi:hypothetical protein